MDDFDNKNKLLNRGYKHRHTFTENNAMGETQNKYVNFVVAALILANPTFYIAAMVEKWAKSNDSHTDIFKLVLILINYASFAGCVFLNKSEIANVKPFYISLFVLLVPFLVAVSINCYLLNQELIGNDTWFNVDYLSMALTFTNDLLFLVLYTVFRNIRAFSLTAVLVVTEAAVFGTAFTQGNDDVIDTVNLTVTVVTAALSIVFWSGRLATRNGRVYFDDYMMIAM